MTNQVLGIRAHDIEASSMADLVSKLKAYRLGAIQLAPAKSFPDEVKEMNDFSFEQAKRWGNYLAESDVEVTVLGSYVNVSSYDEIIRKQAVETFCHYIDVGLSLQAKYVGTETGSVLCGYTKENYSEEAYGLMLGSLQVMVAYAEKKGMKIALEAGINHPLHDVATIKRLLTDLNSENLVIVFDLVNLLTEDTISKQQMIIEESFAAFGHKVVVVHLKDCQFIKGEKVRTPLGKGVVDFRSLMSAIDSLEPLRLILDETPEEEIAASMSFLNHWR